MKTAFLLMIATGKLVSEIHALAMDTEHLRFDKTDSSVSLRIQTEFPAKINFLLWMLILSEQLFYTWNQIVRGNKMVLLVRRFRD